MRVTGGQIPIKLAIIPKFVTNAVGGIGNKPKSETISAGGTSKFHARAVRDITTPTVIPNHFTDNGNGIHYI
jgi:hypothetical protein